ncbi:MAG: hypothetical protein WC817_00765 [Patescibacteria group bacterium]|jgi:hypothetical protein
MAHNSEHKNLRDLVLQKIRLGEVAMRPRWHFVLKSALLMTGVVLLVLTILFVISLGFFVLHLSGVWFVPAFGWGGLGVFLRSLPWLLIGTALLFIGLLEALVRRYPLAYRRPLLYSAISVMVLVFLGGFLVALTPLHHRLLLSAERNELPFAGPLYRGFGGQRFSDVHKGIVTEVADENFDIQTRRGSVIHVTVTSDTRFPFGLAVQPGDNVVVFGELFENTIQALGIGRVDSDDLPAMPRPRHIGPPLFFPGVPSQ